jgi:hypothetical protein
VGGGRLISGVSGGPAGGGMGGGDGAVHARQGRGRGARPTRGRRRVAWGEKNEPVRCVMGGKGG